MSSGLVVCSTCGKEVHQDGPRDAQTGRASWRHCSRLHGWTALCQGATAVYPRSMGDIVGLFCQADGAAPTKEFT